MCKQVAAPATCALRSTVYEVCWVQTEGLDHALRHRRVLVRSRMARRGECDHLVVERETGLVCCGEHRHCGEGLHGAPQRDQSIWLTDACGEATTIGHHRHVTAMCHLGDLAALHHRNHRWWHSLADASVAHASPRALSTSVRPRSITSNAKSSSSFVMMSGGFVKNPFHRTIV